MSAQNLIDLIGAILTQIAADQVDPLFGQVTLPPQLGEDRESCALTGGQALQEVKEGLVVRIDESK